MPSIAGVAQCPSAPGAAKTDESGEAGNWSVDDLSEELDPTADGFPYKVGQIIVVSVSEVYGLVNRKSAYLALRVVKFERPITDYLVLKLFDRRTAQRMRNFCTSIHRYWDELSAEQLLRGAFEHVVSDNGIQRFDAEEISQATRSFRQNESLIKGLTYVQLLVLEEITVARKNLAAFEHEILLYKALADKQGDAIPWLFAHVTLDLEMPEFSRENAGFENDYRYVFEVPGLLMEYVKGPNLYELMERSVAKTRNQKKQKNVKKGKSSLSIFQKRTQMCSTLSRHTDYDEAAMDTREATQEQWQSIINTCYDHVVNLFHQREIINIDFSPRNVIARWTGFSWQPVLIDFGHCVFRTSQTDLYWANLKLHEGEERKVYEDLSKRAKELKLPFDRVHPPPLSKEWRWYTYHDIKHKRPSAENCNVPEDWRFGNTEVWTISSLETPIRRINGLPSAMVSSNT